MNTILSISSSGAHGLGHILSKLKHFIQEADLTATEELVQRLSTTAVRNVMTQAGCNQPIAHLQVEFAQQVVLELCSLLETTIDDVTSLEPSEINWGYVSQLTTWIHIFKTHFGLPSTHY